jgi:nucleotide-binding universal stress UspA family protein
MEVAMYRNILLPTDGSDLAARAVEAGLALAALCRARVTAVSAYEPFQPFALTGGPLEYTPAAHAEQANAECERILAPIRARAEALGLVCVTEAREADRPFRAIVEAAEVNGCDLIVIASHGRRGLPALMIGSVTADVLKHSTIPVLVYR